MAKPMFGTLQEFLPDSEPIAAYLERVAVYFDANEVKEDKQVPVILSVVGSKVYALLRSLAAPKLPKELSFQELEALLKAHFLPKPLTIAERFHFHRRGQAAGESIAEYLAELRSLTRTVNSLIFWTKYSAIDLYVGYAARMCRNVCFPRLN